MEPYTILQSFPCTSFIDCCLNIILWVYESLTSDSVYKFKVDITDLSFALQPSFLLWSRDAIEP